MRHINFCLGAPKWGVLRGGQRVYVEKVHVLFRSPIDMVNRDCKCQARIVLFDRDRIVSIAGPSANATQAVTLAFSARYSRTKTMESETSVSKRAPREF